jgi:hypothetical protein
MVDISIAGWGCPLGGMIIPISDLLANISCYPSSKKSAPKKDRTDWNSILPQFATIV